MTPPISEFIVLRRGLLHLLGGIRKIEQLMEGWVVRPLWGGGCEIVQVNPSMLDAAQKSIYELYALARSTLKDQCGGAEFDTLERCHQWPAQGALLRKCPYEERIEMVILVASRCRPDGIRSLIRDGYKVRIGDRLNLNTGFGIRLFTGDVPNRKGSEDIQRTFDEWGDAATQNGCEVSVRRIIGDTPDELPPSEQPLAAREMRFWIEAPNITQSFVNDLIARLEELSETVLPIDLLLFLDKRPSWPQFLGPSPF